MRSFLLVAIICIAMAVVWSLSSWNIRPVYGHEEGEVGTSDDEKMTLVMYELDAGDTIYYDYAASEACWFSICTFDNTDPFNIILDEKLNLSGTQSAGSFECPTDGRYYLRVAFLGTPPEGMATIDYYTHAFNDYSVQVVTATTTLLIALTVLLAYLAYRDYRNGYGREVLYMGLGIAGGTVAAASLVVAYLNPTVDFGETAFGLLSTFAGALISLCFWAGLFTILREEEWDDVIRVRGVAFSLVKLTAVVLAIAVVFAILALMYVMN